jgi:hypothetical protein
VTVVIVDEPGEDRCYLLCRETERSAPQLIRRWRRRSWIAFVFRTLKHLLATEACQVHRKDVYYGHLVFHHRTDMVTGLVTELTGSLQTGLLGICVLTGVGVIAEWRYPSIP